MKSMLVYWIKLRHSRGYSNVLTSLSAKNEGKREGEKKEGKAEVDTVFTNQNKKINTYTQNADKRLG